MAYNVSSAFREQLYSGESNFRAILTIDGTSIDNDQIASISISSPIIDDSKQVFYIGTFISQKITIHFKDMNGIVVRSGSDVELSIGQYVNNEWVDVPIGKFIIDDLAEDYYKKSEINCLDYGVKFKPNIDYSPCFTDGKATIETILKYICNKVGVELGDCPTINDDIEVGTYDSTVSGKQWVSYIAEIKGCNAKIDRTGKLTLQPLKQSSNIPVNALESASFETGESLKITKVTFFDAIRNFTFGDDTNDTLFIRQDNPFVTNEDVVNNIYHTICTEKYSETGKSFDIDDADANSIDIKTIYGETSQIQLSGKNIIVSFKESTANRINYNLDANGLTTTMVLSLISNTSVNDVAVNLRTITDAGIYTMGNISLVANTKVSFSFTLTTTQINTLKSIDSVLQLYKGSSGLSGVSLSEVQIENGTTATSYEQYCGGVPSPNPSYPQDIHNVSGDNNIQVIGKNLLDISENNVVANIDTVKPPEYMNFEGDGFNLSCLTSWAYYYFYIPLEVGKTYSLKYKTDGNFYAIRFYAKDRNTFISNLDISSGEHTTLFTATEDGIYIRFHVFKNVATLNYAQAEEGTTSTVYEHYHSNIYPINLPVENLLDLSNINWYRNNNSDYSVITDTSTTRVKSSLIEVSGGTYTISGIPSVLTLNANAPYCYDSNKTYLGNGYATFTNNTITIPSNVKYISLILNGTDLTDAIKTTLSNSSMQLETGSKKNSYTPYGTTPIELNKIGNYQDYITKNTGKNLLDISENNDYITTNASQSYLEQTSITFNNGSYIVNATALPSGNGRGDWFYIPLEIGKTYTLNFKTDGSFVNIRLYELNKTTVVYNFPSVSSGTYTFVANENGIYFRSWTGSTTSTLYYAQLEEGYTNTEYEPYGIGEWYLHKETGKVVLDGSEAWELNGQNDTYGQYIYNVVGKANGTLNIYCNRFINEAGANGNYIYGRPNNNRTSITIAKSLCEYSLTAFSNYLSNNNTYFNYLLETPENNKITYQPLIDQLNAYASLFEGVNHITIEPNDLTPTIDINYYKNSNFELTSVKTHNYGDFTLDAYDNIDYNLDGTHYITLNNNTIKYEMSIMGDVNTKIPTKQQQATTNVIGGDDKTNLKIIKTNVDQLNATVDIISKQQNATETNISQLQLDVNGINTEVERIENVEINGQNGIVSQLASVQQTVNNISNMFQITGGINLIRNSAFLLTDELWTFTDSGTNPYHTELGNSYNSALSGDTVSVAEIKLRSIDVKSKSENITDLKTDGTKYTFNFYHKQDNNMTTTIKMYSTEDNTVKAFNDIVITGQQPKTNYSVSFIPTFANYTLEIVVTSTASIGYAYIYDMMLNSGETQSWQPASDEIYSTTLSMSRLGLKVYSVGDGTITLLGSDGLLTYETTDGRTLGRLVSSRTVEGDTTRNITTQALYLTRDITIENPDKWVSTIVTINGSPHKVEYIDRGGQ